jgi:hypothetical protein
MLLLVLDMAFLIFSRRKRSFPYLVFEATIYFCILIHLVKLAVESAFNPGVDQRGLAMCLIFIIGSLVAVLSDTLILGIKLKKGTPLANQPR